MPKHVDFGWLRLANIARRDEVFPETKGWSATDWGCALGGECGELLNVVKKQYRGDFVGREEEARKMLSDEIADTLIQLDYLAEKLGINLGEALVSKFNEDSHKYGSTIFLTE